MDLQLNDAVREAAPTTVTRTWCVIWRAGGQTLWKADVVADDPSAAVTAICYDQGINPPDVIGVIDRSTIR